MKTWFITGCSSGIGRGIAKAVLERGDQAIVTARNSSTLNDLVSQYPDQAFAVSLDLTKRESIEHAVRLVQERYTHVDVLVNNVGHGYRAAIEEGEEEHVTQLFDTNFFGPIELIKKLLPAMRTNKSGAIINVSSIAAVRSGVGSGYYAASKAALELMTNALHQEVSPLGIKVMIVEPGSFRTSFYDSGLRGTQITIDDYSETAWKNRKENVVNHRDQPGDPDRGGRIIVDTIVKDDYPKTLLLGSDAVGFVSAQLHEKLSEIEDWKDTSLKSDFPH